MGFLVFELQTAIVNGIRSLLYLPISDTVSRFLGGNLVYLQKYRNRILKQHCKTQKNQIYILKPGSFIASETMNHLT